MTRANIVLLAVLIACALGLVSAQHKARKLFIELSREQNLEKQYNVEWGQLQLEQSTWATHSRIERIASRGLGMRVPEAAKVRTVTLPEKSAPGTSGGAP
ncbi:MAG: cell division protein FtsL [Burkholderiales bacterium]|nr:cell division protein FtsL [Burkholderiales bacterium]